MDGLSAGRARPDQIRGGNHGLTPEQVAESQRERVLASLRELLTGGRGLAQIPVAEVIRRAGVSRRTFYELWPTKEACFVELYERELERLAAPTLAAFEGDEPWRDRLGAALGVLLGALAADPAAARICFVEVLAAGPLALARRTEAMGAFDTLFEPGRRVEPAPASDEAISRSSAASAGAVGYLSEVLGREIAAGRAAELPRLRGDLLRTLAPPAPEPSADDAGERAFLAGYGELAAELLGRVAAAIASPGADARSSGPEHARSSIGDGAAGGRGADARLSGSEDAQSSIAASEDAPAAVRVRAGVAAVLDFCASEPDRARACLVEPLSVGPAARERRAETTRRLSELLEQPLRELRPSERIARVSAIALVGGLLELIYDPVDRRTPARLPTVDTVVSVVRLNGDQDA